MTGVQPATRWMHELGRTPRAPHALVHSVAAFAASGRVRRRPGDRRAIEAATALRQSLESAVLLRLYPNSEIEVHVQVLQSDGGALAAAVNAATLALIDAGVAMSDYVVGCGVAYIQRTPLLGARGTATGAEQIDCCNSECGNSRGPFMAPPWRSLGHSPSHSPGAPRMLPQTPTTPRPRLAARSSSWRRCHARARLRSSRWTRACRWMRLRCVCVPGMRAFIAQRCDSAARSIVPLGPARIRALPLGRGLRIRHPRRDCATRVAHPPLACVLQPLVDVGLAGCRQIHDIMRTSVAEVTARRLESREAVGS